MSILLIYFSQRQSDFFKGVIFNLNKQHYKEMTQRWNYPNLTPPGRQPRQYESQPSLMDEGDPHSALNQSKMRGFFNMVAILVLIFMFTQPIINKIENGYFLEPYLYTTFKNDYFLCMMVWPLFFLWSLTSFLLQKLILWGLPRWLSVIYQHSTQAGLFAFSSYMILQKNWCSTHAAFVIMQACVHFMKMHSYTEVNRDYRQQMLQAKKNKTKPLSSYPNNINIKDFILFMWTPWLVYDHYPRRKGPISIMYIIKKAMMGLTCVLMCYILHTQYILPSVEQGLKIGFLELMFREMPPSIILLLFIFYLTFQCITNIFAEITKLGHRSFYEDWWNSTSYQEFNRKWNKPVHLFLYRHVYLELIVRQKTSKPMAQFVTFFFSALLHEFLLAMIFRIVRPIFLAFIIFQVPLIYFTKSLAGKKTGGGLFWLGLIIGPSMIVCCYLRVSDTVAHFFARP